MRKGRDGEKMENDGENSGPLMLLPIDRLQRQRLCQNLEFGHQQPFVSMKIPVLNSFYANNIFVGIIIVLNKFFQ